MDETMMSSKKKLKVIVPNQKLPFVVSPPVFPHITALVTICASGDHLNPLIILPNKKTSRNIEKLVDECLLASTEPEWMNKDSFILYSICFCSQITQYRLTLLTNIRNEFILLIVNGHPSRRNYLANYIKLSDRQIYFKLVFHVLTLMSSKILPGHTSHVLQPLDLVVPSPPKNQFKINLSIAQFNLDNLDFSNFGVLHKQTA